MQRLVLVLDRSLGMAWGHRYILTHTSAFVLRPKLDEQIGPAALLRQTASHGVYNAVLLGTYCQARSKQGLNGAGHLVGVKQHVILCSLRGRSRHRSNPCHVSSTETQSDICCFEGADQSQDCLCASPLARAQICAGVSRLLQGESNARKGEDLSGMDHRSVLFE